MKGEERQKVVTLRPMGNRELSDEPEMKELKRMIREGELDQGRTIDHLEAGGGSSEPSPDASGSGSNHEGTLNGIRRRLEEANPGSDHERILDQAALPSCCSTPTRGGADPAEWGISTETRKKGGGEKAKGGE